MNLTKLKQELEAAVDPDSQINREKIDRYISLVKLFRKLKTAANKDPMVITKNGSQEFVKVNPAISDLNKINTSLIALGKDIGLFTTSEQKEGDSSKPNGSDLI